MMHFLKLYDDFNIDLPNIKKMINYIVGKIYKFNLAIKVDNSMLLELNRLQQKFNTMH